MVETVAKAKPHDMTPFIVSTSMEKPSTTTRSFIRSHVMRGKNRRVPKSSRLKPGSWITGKNNSNDQEIATNIIKFPNPGFEFAGSGLSVTEFADNMQPYMLDLVYKFFAILKQSLYPIELCLNVYPRSSIWFYYLHYDTAYLHSLLWMTQAYFDWITRQDQSEASMRHMSKTLQLLQHRLSDSRLAVADTTIAVVVCLVVMSALIGNHDTATKHMVGLHKMVLLRGGERVLKENSQIQMKVCRADLMIALLNDTHPLFFSESLSWSPLLPNDPDDGPVFVSPSQVLRGDKRLESIWCDLASFCHAANLAFQTGRKMNPNLFQEVLISAMYRLLFLRLPDSDNKSDQTTCVKALHLAMIAFSVTVLLQAQGTEIHFGNLSSHLRNAILRLDVDDRSQRSMHLWILVVADISAVTDEDHHWILSLLQQLLLPNGVSTWTEMRVLLKNFLWIDTIHDKGGKGLFD